MADLNIGNSTANIIVNAKHNGAVNPQINNTYDLGTSDLRWKNIYGNLKGNADTATKLTTARTIQTNLASTTSSSFDGSANITPGVTGILPIANGGTGQNDLSKVSVGTAASCTGNAATATKLATARNITIGNRTNSFNGSADIAYNLQDVLISHGNEFNYTFGGIADLWFNYRTETGTNSTTKITDYHFANGQGGTDGVTIHASNFSGNAATATNADKLDNLHAGDFVRAYNTTPDNIDANWGQSFKTFDPIPSGTPPEQSPNISLLSIGNDWSRRKMLAFTYDSDNIYYRRKIDNNFSDWVKLLHSGNYNSYAPTLTGGGANGTWNISINGGAKYLNSYGNTSQENGRTAARGGVYTYNMYNETANGAPEAYLSVIGFGLGANGHVEIAGHWCSNTGLWYRSLRDWADNWYPWNRIWVAGNSITSAVWNDYAEYREADTIQGGRCVREVGDDTLTLTTKRLMRGCSITSDTWGFAQGETEKAKTPIAVAGRVLAYPLEDRELFREYIGYSVCSGPDGTVSLMTEEEELKYPWAIVGTVSAVPDYEEWGGGEMADRPSVKVDGRIWIKVK